MKRHRIGPRSPWLSAVWAVLLACAATPSPPRPPTTELTVDPIDAAVATIRGEAIARHVEVLASDAFAGRFPGQAGEAKTVAYLAAELARLGVHPAVGRGYLQPVPLVEVKVDAPSALDVGRTSLHWPDEMLAWSDEPVTLEDRELVFVGHGMDAPEWNDYGEVDVSGKIAVALPGAPTPELTMSEHAMPSAKAQAAARAGAAALFELRADGAAGVAWSTLAMGARAPKYALPVEPDRPRPAARGILRRDAFAAVLSGGVKALEELEVAAKQPGFTPRALKRRATLTLQTRHRTVVSHNVIGWIEGRERPDEFVLYTAHWDHVGVRPHLDGDTIFNGAVDNATGTAALLVLAAAYAALGQPPERSVVFIATTAEEQGLLGAKHYTEDPVFPLASTAGVINMDALFPFGETRGMTVVAMGSNELEGYLADAAEHVGRKLYPDPVPEAGAFFRSDHYPFAEKGVPAIFAVGGPAQDGPVDPVMVDRFTDYLTKRYHQPADEYDPGTWDMAGIVQDVVTYFRAGLALASDTRFPNWSPTHPFRGRRDAMRRRSRAAAAGGGEDEHGKGGCARRSGVLGDRALEAGRAVVGLDNDAGVLGGVTGGTAVGCRG